MQTATAIHFLVLPNYLKDYRQCGDLRVMDHNTAKVLIVDDDPVIHRNIDSALNEVWSGSFLGG